MLVLIGLFSLILGMGLPTTANYIVVSSLMASVVVSLGAQEGLIVPLIAGASVRVLFRHHGRCDAACGPGQLCRRGGVGRRPDQDRLHRVLLQPAHRGAAVSVHLQPGADPLWGRSGHLQGLLQAGSVFVTATIAMLLFAAATQGYFLARSRIHESLALLLVAFTLFVPNVWLDMVQSPFRSVEPAQFEQVLGEVAEGTALRLTVSGPDIDAIGETHETTLSLYAEGATGAERLASSGLLLYPDGDAIRLDEPMFGSAMAEQLGDFDFYADVPVALAGVEVPAARLPAQIFYIPALLLLGLVILLQRRRQTKPAF